MFTDGPGGRQGRSGPQPTAAGVPPIPLRTPAGTGPSCPPSAPELRTPPAEWPRRKAQRGGSEGWAAGLGALGLRTLPSRAVGGQAPGHANPATGYFCGPQSQESGLGRRGGRPGNSAKGSPAPGAGSRPDPDPDPNPDPARPGGPCTPALGRHSPGTAPPGAPRPPATHRRRRRRAGGPGRPQGPPPLAGRTPAPSRRPPARECRGARGVRRGRARREGRPPDSGLRNARRPPRRLFREGRWPCSAPGPLAETPVARFGRA